MHLRLSPSSAPSLLPIRIRSSSLPRANLYHLLVRRCDSATARSSFQSLATAPSRSRSLATLAKASSYPARPKMAAAMPEWTPPPAPTGPAKDTLPPLKIYNSLVRQKVPFVPISGGNKVTWYSCGPTTYDDSHLVRCRIMSFSVSSATSLATTTNETLLFVS